MRYSDFDEYYHHSADHPDLYANRATVPELRSPSLPGVSLEGITGTWNPSIISTDIAGTFTYTFTPNDPSQCGIVTTMNITITTQITPTFTQIGPLCLNSDPPSLPGVSLEGITGTWNPSSINTTVAGTFTYTFTPNDPSQCGTVTTMNIPSPRRSPRRLCR